MLWMYHADAPEGRLFSNTDDVPAGWVDSPAKIEEADDGSLTGMDKASLLEFAERNGVVVDGRLGADKLRITILRELTDGDGS